MSYVQGVLLAVSEERKEEYRAYAKKSQDMFRDNGALAMRENWGVDVPGGEVTSLPMAVKLENGEAVVLSWIEWPDKATCDKAWEAMMQDPRMAAMGEMPFDGKRMTWGGFETIVDIRSS